MQVVQEPKQGEEKRDGEGKVACTGMLSSRPPQRQLSRIQWAPPGRRVDAGPRNCATCGERLLMCVCTNSHGSLVKGSPWDISFPIMCPCRPLAEQTQRLGQVLAKSCRCWILALGWGSWGTLSA